MIKIHSTALTTIMLSSILAVTADAGPYNGIHPIQSDRFVFMLGPYFPGIDGTISHDDKEGDEGTEVDFQSDLGFDDSDTLPAAGMLWRFSNPSRIQVEYFSVGQNQKQAIDEVIDWGDLEFEVGAEIKADFSLDVLRAFYGYSFVKDDKKEIGVGAGLHYIDIDFSLAGNAEINGEPVINAKRGISGDAILPNIGVYANYALSPKWLIGGRIDWISADIGDYDGTLWNVEASVQYQIWDHVGVALAYRYLDFEIGADKSSGDWDAELEYSGPLLILTANF